MVLECMYLCFVETFWFLVSEPFWLSRVMVVIHIETVFNFILLYIRLFFI